MRKISIIFLLLFPVFLSSQHISVFFDSIPGLEIRYEAFVGEQGLPDRVIWMKDSVYNYRQTGLELTDAFALYHKVLGVPNVTVLYNKHNDQYWDQQGNGYDPPRLRQSVQQLTYREGSNYFKAQWGKKLSGGRPLLFSVGPQGKSKQNDGAAYRISIRPFKDQKRFEVLTAILDALSFKYDVE